MKIEKTKYSIEYLQENGCKIIAETRNYIHAVREDGMNVYFDKSDSVECQYLNDIRLNGSKNDVINAVGLVRGYQIAMNYAKSNGVTLPSIENIIDGYSVRELNK